MSRHYVLDFDGTLVDTDSYWEWVVKQFVGCGVEEKTVREVGEAMFETLYTLELHAKKLGLSDEMVAQCVHQSEEHIRNEHRKLVFPDVHPFFSRSASTKRSILTFGDPVSQRMRVSACGFDPFLSEVQIATPTLSKVELLTGLLEKTDVPLMFIDDDLGNLESVKKSGIDLEVVRIRREGQWKARIDHKFDDEAWRVIRTFDEL